MKKPRKSCGDYIREKAMQNRDRQVEELFNEFERAALLERLNKDAAQREREQRDAATS